MELGKYSTLSLSERDTALQVVIDRPKALNALATNVVEDLDALFSKLEGLEADGWPYRAVIITGSGEKAFAAGADIVEMSEYGPAEGRAYAESMHRVTRMMENLAVPVIAAVNGYALGGGCELALACDWILASENATFGQPEVNLGLIPGFGGSVRLSRRIPAGLAREMILTGNPISAERAREAGLVNTVSQDVDALMGSADATVKAIAKRSPVAVAVAKRAMTKMSGLSTQDALNVELDAFGEVFGAEDSTVGRRAFVDKQTPDFPGR